VRSQRRLTCSELRPVATTEWPAANAAFAMLTPIPRPAPVTNQIFLLIMLFRSIS
jgi:hypothetical protein